MNTTTGNATWKNIIIAVLLTGFVGFWGGVLVTQAKDKEVLVDHESRIRKVEEACVKLTIILETMQKNQK